MEPGFQSLLPCVAGVSTDEEAKPMERVSSDEEPFSALAFKIATDPFVGSLTFARIYSGPLQVWSVHAPWFLMFHANIEGSTDT